MENPNDPDQTKILTCNEIINSIRKSISKVISVGSDWDGYDGYYVYERDADKYKQYLSNKLDKIEKQCRSKPNLYTCNSNNQTISWMSDDGDKHSLSLRKDEIRESEDEGSKGSSITDYYFNREPALSSSITQKL